MLLLASGSFRHSPNDRASVSVLLSDVLPIGASSKGEAALVSPPQGGLQRFAMRLNLAIGDLLALI